MPRKRLMESQSTFHIVNVKKEIFLKSWEISRLDQYLWAISYKSLVVKRSESTPFHHSDKGKSIWQWLWQSTKPSLEGRSQAFAPSFWEMLKWIVWYHVGLKKALLFSIRQSLWSLLGQELVSLLLDPRSKNLPQHHWFWYLVVVVNMTTFTTRMSGHNTKTWKLLRHSQERTPQKVSVTCSIRSGKTLICWANF